MTSFSLDEKTLENLESLPAERESKLLAAEKPFDNYGIPPLDEATVARCVARVSRDRAARAMWTF